jgi:hypothetical protein
MAATARRVSASAKVWTVCLTASNGVYTFPTSHFTSCMQNMGQAVYESSKMLMRTKEILYSFSSLQIESRNAHLVLARLGVMDVGLCIAVLSPYFVS